MLSKSEKQTLDIACKFAKQIKNPCIILLQGDLGAGKTHFVKGFAKGMKCKMLVTSHDVMYKCSSATPVTKNEYRVMQQRLSGKLYRVFTVLF